MPSIAPPQTTDSPPEPPPGVQPWPRLDLSAVRVTGRWARINYSQSFFDPLIRPILRLRGANGTQDIFLPGALHGRGIWIGFIPKDTLEASILPIAGAGPCGFAIEKIEPFATNRVLRRAYAGSREKTLAWLSARVRGMDVEAMEEITYALCHAPLSQYQTWRRRRLRPLDISGIDRPAHDWREGPRIRFAVVARAGSAPFLARLLSGLAAQPYPHWSVALIGASVDDPAFADAVAQGRLLRLDERASAAALARGLAPGDLIGRCAARDTIPQSAPAILAECAASHPRAGVFYGDEDRVSRADHYFAPVLKPDWSPLFQAHANYMGAAVFARAGVVARAEGRAALFANPSSPVDSIISLDGVEPIHIRRILLSRAGAGRPAGKPVIARPAAISAGALSATIIIPTRDRLDLLRACVSSVVAKSGSAAVEIVIVDNGSVQPETLTYLAQLERRPGFQIVRHPGPFNFSALCNDGAKTARHGTLVFLNNDTEVLTENWLAPLTALAQAPGIGAVGAKLLFPSGRLQHAGVVVGLAGRAGHLHAGLEQGSAGYGGRVDAPREVTAVTGACLAVSAERFHAAGGFNAGDLPIDLNDVDLCLRLREQGLRNIYTPECQLIHRESETRRRAARPSRVYAREWAYFTARWGAAMRDDPCFHPALSLYSTTPALG